MIESKELMIVVLLLALTNVYTVYLVLQAGHRAEARIRIEFYRGFYAARLLLRPGQFNHCRKLTHLAIAEQMHQANLPGWRWPLPRVYSSREIPCYPKK